MVESHVQGGLDEEFKKLLMVPPDEPKYDMLVLRCWYSNSY